MLCAVFAAVRGSIEERKKVRIHSRHSHRYRILILNVLKDFFRCQLQGSSGARTTLQGIATSEDRCVLELFSCLGNDCWCNVRSSVPLAASVRHAAKHALARL